MAEELDDKAFHELRDLLLRKSFRDLASIGLANNWGRNRPPSEYWLPIDDVIDRLIERNAPPRIDLTQPASRQLIDDGPYRLSRSHLHFAISDMHRDPEFEENQFSFLKDFAGKLMAADNALKEVSEIFWREPAAVARRGLSSERMASLGQTNPTLPPHEFSEAIQRLPKSELWEEMMRHGKDIDQARDALFGLVEIVVREAATTRVIKNVGPQQVLWKRDFVWRLSHLWRLLTGEKPSKAEDSMFGGFVYAAWDSLGGDMPEVSFARAIRDNPYST